MIIYSETGQRPCDLAYEKIKEEKNICCVQIKDKNKYIITRSMNKDKLDSVFDGATPYCLCDEIEKTQGELKPFLNPAVVCMSDKGNWVMCRGYKLFPIGSYKKMEDQDIFYLDFEYVKKETKVLPYYKPKQQSLDNIKFKDETAKNFWMQLKDLFDNDYYPAYSVWSRELKCWVTTYDGKPRHPLGYPQVTILKTGGWDVDWAEIAPNIPDYAKGYTTNKTLGRIEKFIMGEIKETKAFARKNAFDMDYYDKEYYMLEMQGAFLTLRACLHLKRCGIKITEDVLKYMSSKVKEENGWPTGGLRISSYIDGYIEQVCDKIL